MEDKDENLSNIVDGSNTEDEEEKPLLPKNFCWTWPNSVLTWVIWGFGALALGFGIMNSIISLQAEPLIYGSIGLLILGFASPNPFKSMMSDMLPDSSQSGTWSIPPLPPMDPSEWHLDRVEWNEKVGAWLPDPLARYEQDGPKLDVKEDGKEWVTYSYGEEDGRFETEAEAYEQMKKVLKKADTLNSQEMIFGEHPRHHRYRALYNTTPPQITARFLFHSFSVMFLTGVWLSFPVGEERQATMPFLMVGLSIGAVSVIISYFLNKRVMEAWDTVTSIVKFVDAGHNELVGQVRPASFEPLETVHVDGYRDSSWTFDNLVAWNWSYSVYHCWKERYQDSEGNWRTKTECAWKSIRWDGGASPFLLHDGSGGLIVDLPTFKNSNFGNAIWEKNKRGRKGGNGLYTKGDVRKHRWTLSGLKLGDPVYTMARIKGRPHDEIPRGTVSENASRVHHTLVAVGEDAPRRHAIIQKGTEFSVLKAKSSALGKYGPSALLILSSIALMVTAI
ncbi:MAG: hypothetical protein P8Q39_02160 [Candidatus Thalassarchaeaceae archaeon]|nr:hypothetical protein [Candidatus Thalassarchaeaceae archaeon]